MPLWSRQEFTRRLKLARQPNSKQAKRPNFSSLIGELSVLREPFVRPFRDLKIDVAEAPCTVMLLPGFASHPVQMRYLAKNIERAGHTVKRWGLGFNLGPTAGHVEQLGDRLIAVHERYGRDVVLIGWSLGGLFARELAKQHPDRVAKVITMGSPFSGDPRANNAWRIYQFVAGHPVDRPPVEYPVSTKPPVETVALWSESDGIIHPPASRGEEGERDRAVQVDCNHIGFSYAPESISAVLKELAQV